MFKLHAHDLAQTLDCFFCLKENIPLPWSLKQTAVDNRGVTDHKCFECT